MKKESFLHVLNQKAGELVHRAPGHLYWLYFILHRLKSFHFDLTHTKANGKVLFKLSPHMRLDATRQGELKVLSSSKSKLWFFLRNLFTLGATQARVYAAIEVTFIVLSLELNNPFTKEILLRYLDQKEKLLKSLINKSLGNRRTQISMGRHLDEYLRNSQLQLRIIERMHRACARQRKEQLCAQAAYFIPTPGGLSGSYLVHSKDHKIMGIFKPFDEEMGAPNNPSGHLFQGALGQRRVRLGCRVGESAHHEVGASLVDAFFGFDLVPKTVYANFSSDLFAPSKKKYGSFQEYVHGCCPITHVTDEALGAISLLEYQLVLLLDVMIGNQDRGFENFLIQGNRLIAIDHGLAFPDRLGDELSTWWWESELVAEHPFDSQIHELLKDLPFNELAWKLRKQCMLELPALYRMQERLALFSEGVFSGLSPLKIKDLMQDHYLTHLLDLNTTLSFKAKEIVQNYVSALKTKR